ncbi:Acetoacetyl CoA synthase NphT7 [Actinomadura rubteroloni]|uniref:Acetoacetyl CoA synthase NphT7 n=1 Tax=Actinomadura rubteroloni TaxID=1926885 RepID=A0A2P4UCQ0_9ACTN|nr:ketoacyl-ACP synthase III [Actinomadura rubteroloni]POM22821.1 Acetoacetyl CoA synthase NphT7 [Actinomadura rubteroloni]
MPAGILAMGGHVPPDVVGNDTIAAWADTTPAWIETRTGVLERRWAAPETPTSELALAAVRDLLRTSPAALDDLGAIIVATSTPDQPQPSTAVIVQDLLAAAPVPAWDVNAVCSGFLYSLVMGAALVKDGGAPVLIVGADKYSSIVDGTDRRTVSLFGDGGGAVVLGDVPEGYGLRASRLAAHGRHRAYVEVVGGGTRRPLDTSGLAVGDHLFRMQGRPVRDYLFQVLPGMIHDVLDDAGMKVGDVDRFIFHQANPRLLQELSRDLGIDPGKMPLTADWFGNTGAASVPLTLWHSDTTRPLERGEQVLLASVGGGMTAAAAVMTWY